MQVSVESTTGLERRLTVELPEEGVEREVGTRLDNLMRTARIPGFRPGKAPMKVVVRRFGAAVRDEVVGDLLRSSFADALASEELRPAGEPQIDSVESEPGTGLRYTAVFEVFPDIRLTDLESVEVRRPTAEVREPDVDHMVETLRTRRREWREVTRGAEDGDRITFDVEGEVDGEPLEGSVGENRVVEVGAGHAVPDLDRGLVGMEPGTARDIEVTYGEDHPSPRLAGKTATMHVEARKVEEGVLPEVDADFIRALGVESGDLDEFRRDVHANLERELEAAVAAVTRNRLLDALLERHPVEVPASLVAGEFARAGLAGAGAMAGAGAGPLAEAPGDAEREAAEAAARRRLQQGLLLAQIVSDQDLAPDPGAVRAEIERMAATYEDPAQVISWFYSDPSRLRPMESRLVEQQAIEAMLARVKVLDEPSEFDELMNPGQTSEASF